MKKLFIVLIVFAFAFNAMSQSSDDPTNKKVQVGIGFGSGATFNRLGTNKAQKDGAGYNVHLGVDLNYNFVKNVGLYTGLHFDLEGFKYKFDPSDRVFYNFNDKEILRKKDIADVASYDSLLLTNRSYRPIYLSLPTMLIFKTDQIGYMKYFGKFGLRTNFLLSQKAHDQGFLNGDNNQPVDYKNMNLKTDLLWIRSSVGIAGGVEWNFTGSTVLVGEVGFYYAFTNAHYSKAVGGDDEARNYHLYQNTEAPGSYTGLKNNQMQLLFRVAVLF